MAGLREGGAARTPNVTSVAAADVELDPPSLSVALLLHAVSTVAGRASAAAMRAKRLKVKRREVRLLVIGRTTMILSRR